MRLPLVISIPNNSRNSRTSRKGGGPGNRCGRRETDEISNVSFDSTSETTVHRLYSKFHPIIWMLLMFMAVSLHARYLELFDDEGSVQIQANRAYEDHIQRKISDIDNERKASDLSSLVMSLIQPMHMDDQLDHEETHLQGSSRAAMESDVGSISIDEALIQIREDATHKITSESISPVSMLRKEKVQSQPFSENATATMTTVSSKLDEAN